MKRDVILWGLFALMGAVMVFLNGWVYLLEGEIRFLLWGGLGLLFIIGGVVRMRRALGEQGMS